MSKVNHVHSPNLSCCMTNITQRLRIRVCVESTLRSSTSRALSPASMDQSQDRYNFNTLCTTRDAVPKTKLCCFFGWCEEKRSDSQLQVKGLHMIARISTVL